MPFCAVRFGEAEDVSMFFTPKALATGRCRYKFRKVLILNMFFMMAQSLLSTSQVVVLIIVK